MNISEEMLKVARKQKKEKPLGIQYHLENTTQLEQIESFDLIIWSLPFLFWTTPKTRTFALYAC